jgi:hypothetical protein
METTASYKTLKIALGTIFLCFIGLLPGHASADAIKLNSYVTATSTGIGSMEVEIPAGLNGHGYLVNYYTKNSNYYTVESDNIYHCYPLNGGSAGFSSNITIALNSSIHQTSNTGFGAGACNITGYYYVVFKDTTASSTYYAQYYYNQNTNTFSNTAPSNPIKNIEVITPTYGTTTATTTYQVSVRYYTPFTIDLRPTTVRHYEIVDAITNEIEFEYNFIVASNTTESITITATTTTPQGSKYIRAMYLDLDGNTYSEMDEVFFNVATNTYLALTGLETPNSENSEFSQINCELYDIGCQFQKVLVFLFIPPSNTLDRFSNLWQGISEKKPFGYVSMTIDQLNDLDQTGSVAFDLGTIPFMDSIFTPFRTLMAGILWSLFAIWFYQRRLIHLDI